MAVTAKIKRSRFHPFSLDAVNFPAADVRGAVGPYLNVFLVTSCIGARPILEWLPPPAALSGSPSRLRSAPRSTNPCQARRPRFNAGGIGRCIRRYFCLPDFLAVAIANSLMAVAGDVLAAPTSRISRSMPQMPVPSFPAGRPYGDPQPGRPREL
jgi:hypothetical protein